jgi:sec-independent protein translocase protein TatA
MENLGFIQNIGVGQLLIILVIVLLLFGSRKLPDLARSLGSSMKELRKGMNESDDKKAESQTASDKSRAS